MGSVLLTSAFVVVWISAVAVQQPSSSAAPALVDSPPSESVKLFNGLDDAIQPQLLPLAVKEPPDPNCKGKKQDGSVQFELIVDAEGHPRNIVIERATDNEIDYLALQTVEEDWFHPAKFDGAAVAAKGTLEIHLNVCTEKSKNAGSLLAMRYRSIPEQKFESLPLIQEDALLAPVYISEDERRAHTEKTGKGMTLPRPFLQPEAAYSDLGRSHHIQGECEFSLIVDEHGLPRDIKVVHPMESSMLANAARAVMAYRFKPATRRGMPIPVSITAEVNFHMWPG